MSDCLEVPAPAVRYHGSKFRLAPWVISHFVVSGYPNAMYDDALRDWTTAETRARISAGRGTAMRTERLWISPRCFQAIEASGLFGEDVA